VSLLLAISLRGALAFLLAEGFDRLVAGRLSTGVRRSAWIAAGLAFLLPIHLPLPHRAAPFPAGRISVETPEPEPEDIQSVPLPLDTAPAIRWFFGLWLAGTAGFLGVSLLQTTAAARRWAGERLSTDSRLLAILEDAKAEAGVTAPLGLVVSARVPAPALLGWLRPRILLPAGLAAELPPERLRAILLHELAHFRFLDIPANCLFSLARALHWFNPLAHLAARSWNRFREEAADAAALRWMETKEGDAFYAETLLETARRCSGSALPYGAVGIGESARHLKRRLTMIARYRPQTARPVPVAVLAVLFALAVLAVGAFPLPAQNAATDGDEKQAAQAAMETWLPIEDRGDYGTTWDQSSEEFKKAVTRTDWIAICGKVRPPLGKCLNRKLASAVHQVDTPMADGTVTNGDYVVAQYETAFENMKYALETVSFKKEPDGAWRMAGYLIKPRT